MDLIYENLKSKAHLDKDREDFICMKIAFLEGIRFQSKLEQLLHSSHTK